MQTSFKPFENLHKTRLFVPIFQSSRRWLWSNFLDALTYHKNARPRDTVVHPPDFSEPLYDQRDPSHLSPVTWWERKSVFIRTVLRYFASSQARFALRVTCATMSIAVIAFLERTQIFYSHHLVCGQHTIEHAMQPSAGQSLRHFLL